MATGDDTTAVVDLEVDWFLGLLLLLKFRVPHSRLPGVGRRGCATVALLRWAMNCGGGAGEERVHAGSRTEVGVSRNDCGEVASKPAPSPAARVRHPEIQRLLFGWCGRVGHPPNCS